MNFKEYTNEAKNSFEETNTHSTYSKYLKDFGCAIEDIGRLIEYGRSIDMDNKQINPLLDAIKGLHLADDAIRASYEKSIEEPEPIEPEEEPVEPEDKW